MAYLNRKMKKGNADTTGYAWWYDARLEDKDNPSHYPGFIPLSELRAFFGWNAEESVEILAKFVINGQEYVVPCPRFKAIGRSDWIVNGIPEGEEIGADKVLDIANIDYGVHNPQQVFIQNVAALFDGGDNIGCESLGELKWGRRLFASFSVPQNLRNDATGLEFRPILTVVTSYDQTLATKYVRTHGVPVCDNTLNAELVRAGEKDGHFVLRHTKNSANRLADAKAVLGILTQEAEQMDAWLTELANIEVSTDEFAQWVKKMVPDPGPKETVKEMLSETGEKFKVKNVSTHAQTAALNTQAKLIKMWTDDHRVKDLPDSRAKILQLWNTFQQHESGIKVTSKYAGKDATEEEKVAAKVNVRIDKNFDKMANPFSKGSFMNEDLRALDIITQIQAEKVSVPVTTPRGKRAAAAAK
jgi:hypothetical protein